MGFTEVPCFTFMISFLLVLIPAPLRFTNLLYLDLSNNNLDSLTEHIGELKKLKELCVSHNKITSLEGLEVIVTLTELDLSNNSISDVSLIEKIFGVFLLVF